MSFRAGPWCRRPRCWNAARSVDRAQLNRGESSIGFQDPCPSGDARAPGAGDLRHRGARGHESGRHLVHDRSSRHPLHRLVRPPLARMVRQEDRQLSWRLAGYGVRGEAGARGAGRGSSARLRFRLHLPDGQSAWRQDAQAPSTYRQAGSRLLDDTQADCRASAARHAQLSEPERLFGPERARRWSMAQALVRNRTDDPVPAMYTGGAPLAVASMRQQPARRHRPSPHRAHPAAGANGFPAEETLATVRVACWPKTWWRPRSPGVWSNTSACDHSCPRLAAPADRSRAALTLVARELANSEIAGRLFNEEMTVTTHLSRVHAYESGPVRAVPGSSSRRMRSCPAAISGVARMSSRSAETSWSMSSTERMASS